MRGSGRVETIWIKRARGGPLDSSEQAEVVAGRGLVGNADQGGKRQVTVIEREVFETIGQEMGRVVDPVVRRANVLVSGIRLAGSRGRVLCLGDVRVRVYGETRPCRLMDESVSGLREALSPGWRGGVFGEVLNDGVIHVGDVARWGGNGDAVTLDDPVS